MKKRQFTFSEAVEKVEEKKKQIDAINESINALKSNLADLKKELSPLYARIDTFFEEPGFLKSIRNEGRLTLQRVANRFDKPLSTAQLSNVENGRQRPTLAILKMYVFIQKCLDEGTLPDTYPTDDETQEMFYSSQRNARSIKVE